jgi:hypothetical protein
MKNQRRFAPTKPGRFAPEQVAAFLRNQWPESAEYAILTTAENPERRRMDSSFHAFYFFQALQLFYPHSLPTFEFLLVRIPVIPATDSGGSRPPVPEQGGRV